MSDTNPKRCSTCALEKPLENFHRRSDGKIRNQCKVCVAAYKRKHREEHKEALNADRKRRYHLHREASIARTHAWRIENRYGITPAQYEQRLAAQGGLCALCREPQQSSRRLCVDHDHETGIVRGLLCVQCNSALGKLGDTVEGLERAIRYLRAEPVVADLLADLT